MPGPSAAFVALLAQAAPKGAAADGGGPNLLMTLLPAVAIFYFIVLLPKQREDRKLRDAVKAMKKNDKVLTASGIYGVVVSTSPEEDRVVLRVDDERNVKMEFTRASIARVLTPPGDKDKDKAVAVADGAKSR